MFASRRLLFAALLLTITAWSVPARAAVHADFNGDSILDTATLEPGSPPATKVCLSEIGRTLKSDDSSIDSAGPDDTPGVVDTSSPGAMFALAGSRLHVSTSPRVPFSYQRSSPSRAPPA